MVNTAFTNYIDQFNLTKDLKFSILTNKTMSKYMLLMFLNNSRFDDSLITTPQTLKEYIAQYKHDAFTNYIDQFNPAKDLNSKS